MNRLRHGGRSYRIPASVGCLLSLFDLRDRLTVAEVLAAVWPDGAATRGHVSLLVRRTRDALRRAGYEGRLPYLSGAFVVLLRPVDAERAGLTRPGGSRIAV